jgi:zinc protease
MTFHVGDDAFRLSGRCTPADLETQLQLLAAYLVAPGFRAEAAEQFQVSADGHYAQLERTPEGIYQRKVDNFLHSGDPRFGTPDRETMRQRTMEEVKAWLSAPLGQGYMEVAIVGDVDPGVAMELLAKTLGALPERAAEKPWFAEQRNVRFPASPKVQDFRFAADAPRAMVVVAWPTTDGRDFTRSFQLGVLASVLGDRVRVKVREELGASYSPAVGSSNSHSLTDYGFIGAQLVVEPNQASELGTLVAQIAAELQDGSVSDDEFERAIRQEATGIEQAVRNNGFWLSVIGSCQDRPQVLDSARNMARVLQSVTKAEIAALAKEYLAKEQATIVTLTPEVAANAEIPSSTVGATAAR